MKIPLKRFCHYPATLMKQHYQELDNGNDVPINKKILNFTFANLSQSIGEKLSNLGNASSNKKVIATLDPRLEDVTDSNDYFKIQIGKSLYKIDDISKDESEVLLPFYELTIEIDDSNSDDAN